jgi:hypothetical protein
LASITWQLTVFYGLAGTFLGLGEVGLAALMGITGVVRHAVYDARRWGPGRVSAQTLQKEVSSLEVTLTGLLPSMEEESAAALGRLNPQTVTWRAETKEREVFRRFLEAQRGESLSQGEWLGRWILSEKGKDLRLGALLLFSIQKSLGLPLTAEGAGTLLGELNVLSAAASHPQEAPLTLPGPLVVDMTALLEASLSPDAKAQQIQKLRADLHRAQGPLFLVSARGTRGDLENFLRAQSLPVNDRVRLVAGGYQSQGRIDAEKLRSQLFRDHKDILGVSRESQVAFTLSTDDLTRFDRLDKIQLLGLILNLLSGPTLSLSGPALESALRAIQITAINA